MIHTLYYADLNNDGVIQPAAEIVEENNYYPFGLKHQGYNDLPGDGYKYKFLNKEYESSFGLNVTETDFRQYDSALGRFHTADLLSELAPDLTPYRYGFNNPVFWSDPSGLFETWDDAQKWIDTWDLKTATISYNQYKGIYEITNGSVSFYQRGEDIISSMYSMDTDEIIFTITRGGAVSGGGGFGDSFLGFTPSEMGILANAGGVYFGGLKHYANDYANYKFKAATKTHSADDLTKLNKARMGKIAKRASRVGKGLTVVSAGATVVDGLTNGWQNHHTADLVITGTLYAIAASNPAGWVVGGIYFIADMAVISSTGKSITENLFD